MAVTCANCGFELLGAVNRCWRCGTPVVSRPGDVTLPPIRRPPLGVSGDAASGALTASMPAVVVARIVDAPSAAATAAMPGDAPVVARRVGSPFAPSSLVPPGTGIPAIPRMGTTVPVTPTNYAAPSPAVGGAIAAVVLGAISLGACFFTAGAIVSAALGLAMGVWGLRSPRRWTARLGILLCCVALAIGGFRGIVALYEFRYGYKPWHRPAAVEEESPDDFSVPPGP